MTFTLPHATAEVVTFAPVLKVCASSIQIVQWPAHRWSFRQQGIVSLLPLLQVEGLSFAAVGLMHMLNGGAAVRAASLSKASSGGSVGHVDVRGAGTFLMYCSQRPNKVLVCGLGLMSSWHAVSGALTVEVPPMEDLFADLRIEF